MVYISSPTIATASRQSVMQAQSDLAKAQQELSSGSLADAGLTLGSRSGQLLTITGEQKKLQALTDGNALATTRLGATAAALDAIRTAATSFLTALTTAATGSNTTSLSSTAGTDLAALTSALNTSASGQYVFAGLNTDAKPLTTYAQFPASPGKQAVDDAFVSTFGMSQTSAGAASLDTTAVQSFLDGPFASLFDAGSFGTSWSSASDQAITSQISGDGSANTSVSANQSAFRQLAQAYTMVTEFGGGDLSAGATKAVVASATALINKALSGLTDLQTSVGASQSAISSANNSMASQISVLDTQFSALDGVDSYALATKVSSLQTQIQASYELTAKLQQLSLVNYLT